jgi:hypothetical protein
LGKVWYGVQEEELVSMLDLEDSLSVRRGRAMKIRELIDFLQTMDPEQEAFVALFKLDGTGQAFAIDEVSNTDGDAQLEIYEAEAEGADAEDTE